MALTGRDLTVSHEGGDGQDRTGQDRTGLTDRRRVLFLVKCFFGARCLVCIFGRVSVFIARNSGPRAQERGLVWDVNTTRRNGGKGRTEIQT